MIALYGKKVKTTVTTRLDLFTLFCLDKVVQNVGGTRTSTAVSLLEEGIFEGLVALGYDFESLKTEYFKQSGQGVFVGGVPVDDINDLLINPKNTAFRFMK